MCGCLSHSPTGNLAHNPGMYPDGELNHQLFGSQVSTQSTEPHQPGLLQELFSLANQVSGLGWSVAQLRLLQKGLGRGGPSMGRGDKWTEFPWPVAGWLRQQPPPTPARTPVKVFPLPGLQNGRTWKNHDQGFCNLFHRLEGSRLIPHFQDHSTCRRGDPLKMKSPGYLLYIIKQYFF